MASDAPLRNPGQSSQPDPILLSRLRSLDKLEVDVMSPGFIPPSHSLHEESMNLSDISQALPQSAAVKSPAGPGLGFSFATPAIEAAWSESMETGDSDMRAESGSGAEPMMDEGPPSVPGSPTYPHSMSSTPYSRAQSGGSSMFPRVNSFDSTTATLGSPRTSISGLESPFPGPSPNRLQSLIVMRHSERLDDVDPSWVATSDRPWDPPITEHGKGLAFEAGRRLRSEAWGISRVVVSPFLRCVQTAAEVVAALAALELPLSGGSRAEVRVDPSRVKVSLDYGLGELMNTMAMPSLKGKEVGALTWLLPVAELEALLPAGTVDRSYGPTLSQLTPFAETEQAARMRFARTFDAIADRYPDENILCISHGEGVSVSVSRLLPVTVYKVNYCAFSWAQRPIFARGDEEGDSKPGGEWELVTESGPTGISWIV